MASFINQYVRTHCIQPVSSLEIDAALTRPSLITLQEVEELSRLEPYGAGNNRPVFCLRGARLESMQSVGQMRKRMAASDIPNRKDFYVASLSTKSIIYKGMLESMQLRHYFPDLTNPYLTSGLALVHSRFSTNTFPTWSLAQPFRLLAHNGEINTIRGNRGWMEARESVLSSPRIPNIDEIRPIIQPDMSDSASLDNVLEFFVASGMKPASPQSRLYSPPCIHPDIYNSVCKSYC